ncbi:MAG: hypothetical protein QM642_07745 [Edaphocola sp.]
MDILLAILFKVIGLNNVRFRAGESSVAIANPEAIRYQRRTMKGVWAPQKTTLRGVGKKTLWWRVEAGATPTIMVFFVISVKDKSTAFCVSGRYNFIIESQM